MRKSFARLVFTIRLWLQRLIFGTYDLKKLLGYRELQNQTKIIYQAALLSNYREGDYLEFGVWKGNSFIEAHRAVQNALHLGKAYWNKEGLEGRYIAFDSFEGLPEIEGIDKTGPFKKGSFKCEEDKFLSNIRDAGMDLNKVHTVAGWFDETLTEATKEKLGLEKVRIAHIDVDLYESAKVVLRFLTSLIQEGTILIFDDWFEFAGNPQRGEQKAFYEWLEENPQFQAVGYMCEYPFRNSFIITYRVNE